MIRFRNYRGFVFVVLSVLILALLFSLFDISKIIEDLGVHNSYAILFFIALFGGVSSLTSSSYYVSVTALAVAGFDPVILSLVAGVGLSLGDGLFYWIGTLGRRKISGRIKNIVDRWASWIARQPKRFVQIIIFLYTGCTPLPADILMISLSFARFPYRSFIIPGLLGNITFVLIIAFATRFGVSLFG